MIDFTIMEYNFETRKYTVIGLAHGKNSSDAKQNYINKNGWVQKHNTFLFAKPPLCR
tara:strand:+ start:405 stop:575 length:171 start_codon:yes stop_codon:yes gene_type:complete